MKRRLFNIAWSVAKHFDTFAEALRHAWKVVKLQVELCLGTVQFKYRKIDGSIREATGTLESVPPVKGAKRPANYSLLTYFDLAAQDWRSAKIENLIF